MTVNSAYDFDTADDRDRINDEAIRQKVQKQHMHKNPDIEPGPNASF